VSEPDPARLVQEQKALRTVATLVARGLASEQIFAAVTEQAGRLLGADLASLSRFETDGTMTTVAAWSREGVRGPVGVRWELDGENIATAVARARGPVRMDHYDAATGGITELAREQDARQAVGTPVVVEGVTWGVMAAFATGKRPLPTDTEERLAEFTSLIATAVANAESRAELAASRARIVAAADEARRRIERDLHDGAQQRLVALGLELRAAQSEVPAELSELSEMLAAISLSLSEAQRELREIARGIHPAILAEGGLEAAVKTLSRRSPIPVTLEYRPHPRLSEQVEVGAYYVVTEALTNAAKHGSASQIWVRVELEKAILRICVRDDGAGGADPRRGSGLIGLKDRVDALGGTISVDSPPAEGTSLQVALPTDVD
jgi:signal transduction histidine kinase